jgi:hypothetical protein
MACICAGHPPQCQSAGSDWQLQPRPSRCSRGARIGSRRKKARSVQPPRRHGGVAVSRLPSVRRESLGPKVKFPAWLSSASGNTGNKALGVARTGSRFLISLLSTQRPSLAPAANPLGAVLTAGEGLRTPTPCAGQRLLLRYRVLIFHCDSTAGVIICAKGEAKDTAKDKQMPKGAWDES